MKDIGTLSVKPFTTQSSSAFCKKYNSNSSKTKPNESKLNSLKNPISTSTKDKSPNFTNHLTLLKHKIKKWFSQQNLLKTGNKKPYKTRETK